MGANGLGSGKCGMKVGHLADLHLDTTFRWAGIEGGRRWRRAIRQTLVAAVDLAIEQEVDAFFLAGDIYEHDLAAPDTGTFLVEQLGRLDPTPVLVAPGNHDYLCTSSIWVQGNWSPNVRIFGHSTWTCIELVDGLNIWGIAHGAPAGTGPMLERLTVATGGINIGLFHGALRSGVPEGATSADLHLPFDLEDIDRVGLDHVFSGHYHTPKKERRLTYPGNAHPLGFGEGPGRGLVIAAIAESGEVDAVTHDVSPTRFHDLTVDLTGATTSDEVRQRCQAALVSLRGGARLTLTGDLSANVDLDAAGLRDLTSQLDAVVVRTDQLEPGYDLAELQHEPTVRGQFVREVLGDSTIDDANRTAVLVTGLRALDGRSDLEVPW